MKVMLNADFDGDILNIMALFLEEFVHIFRKFDPIERYIMSRDDGKLNPLFTIGKGQLIDLYYYAHFREEQGLDPLDEEALMEHIRKKIEEEKQESVNDYINKLY